MGMSCKHRRKLRGARLGSARARLVLLPVVAALVLALLIEGAAGFVPWRPRAPPPRAAHWAARPRPTTITSSSGRASRPLVFRAPSSSSSSFEAGMPPAGGSSGGGGSSSSPPRRRANGTAATARGRPRQQDGRPYSSSSSSSSSSKGEQGKGGQHQHQHHNQQGPSPASSSSSARPPRPSARHLEINRELLGCGPDAGALLAYVDRVGEEMNFFNFATLFNRCVRAWVGGWVVKKAKKTNSGLPPMVS